MRRAIIALLTGAALGVAAGGAALAAPANGTPIAEGAASASMLQPVYWYHHYRYRHHPRWWYNYNYRPYHHSWYCRYHRCWY